MTNDADFYIVNTPAGLLPGGAGGGGGMGIPAHVLTTYRREAGTTAPLASLAHEVVRQNDPSGRPASCSPPGRRPPPF